MRSSSLKRFSRLRIPPWDSFLFRFQSQLSKAMVPRREVVCRGLKYTLQCDNGITHYRWESCSTKEPETLDWIDDWMRDGDLLFDVGANIGIYALYAALRHPGSRVVAIEPEYANLHLLRDNVLANRLQDRIEVYSVALSNETGISYLHIQDTTPGSALHTEHRHRLTQTRLHYPVVWREGISRFALDDFCQELNLQPNCLKIDVDGTELAVLEGGRRTISSEQFRSLLVELPDPQSSQECTAQLTKAGLRCVWKDPEGKSSNEVWVR